MRRDRRRRAGNRAAAREWFGKLSAIAERLAAVDPGNAEFQRDLSVSYNGREIWRVTARTPTARAARHGIRRYRGP